MGAVLTKMVDKLWEILSTLSGWIAGVTVFALNLLAEYVSGHEASIYIVLFVVVLDAAWGIGRALKLDEYTTSSLMRDSVAKLAVYGTLMLVFIGFDKIGGFGTSISVTIVSSLIILVEAWSVMGNILIVYPDFPVLKLLSKYLTGEIANKLNVDPDQVEEVLKHKGK